MAAKSKPRRGFARRLKDSRSKRQKQLERRATAAERRRRAIAIRYGLDGDDDTRGYPRPNPTGK